MEKLTLSVDELAATMGISRPKAYELVHTPGFPAVTVGRRIRVPVEPLREWLAQQSAAPRE